MFEEVSPFSMQDHPPWLMLIGKKQVSIRYGQIYARYIIMAMANEHTTFTCTCTCTSTGMYMYIPDF